MVGTVGDNWPYSRSNFHFGSKRNQAGQHGTKTSNLFKKVRPSTLFCKFRRYRDRIIGLLVFSAYAEWILGSKDFQSNIFRSCLRFGILLR